MNWLAKWWQRIVNATAANPPRWLIDVIHGGNESDSGIAINGKTALGYAPVWYAVNKIAGHVGQLPIEHREWVDEDTSQRIDSWASWLVNYQPNEWMTPSTFRETLTHHALLWGNGRAAILRNDRREPIELLPLLPDRTVTLIVDGEKWHVVTESNGDKRRIRDVDVLHIPGLGYDGIQGYSLLEIARNSIGMGLAAEKHINRHFKNQAVPSMVLQAPPGVFRDQQEANAFLSKWNEFHTGVDNAGKAGLLREGIEAKVLAVNGRDAQWLEERVFQRQEAALWFLLESILGDNASVSYNSLEQKNMAYVSNCLMRWLVRWEEELARKLQTRVQFESQKYYFKFKLQALLRGTTKERYEVYQIARMNEIMSADEVRSLEDMPPRDPEGDYNNPNKRAVSSTPDHPNDGDTDNQSNVASLKLAAVARRAIAARLDGFAKIETKRIQEAAVKHAGKFVSWVDEFYADFQPRIEEAVTVTGGTIEDAAEWVEESKQRLLECAGSATFETLSATVTTEVNQWPIRVETLAANLVERQK